MSTARNKRTFVAGCSLLVARCSLFEVTSYFDYANGIPKTDQRSGSIKKFEVPCGTPRTAGKIVVAKTKFK